MALDKFTSTWVSHSSMGDFIKCPRSYYLRNVYKNPKTRRKMNIVNPALSLGVSVHEVLEALHAFPIEERRERMKIDKLMEAFLRAWSKVSGQRGGFPNESVEKTEKERAWSMIERVAAHPAPLLEKTVRLKELPGELLPNYYISEEERIILCGKIDWLISKPEDDSICVLDFKTGRHEEVGQSLQLPIYQLLLKNLQKRKVTGACYWYIDRDTSPKAVELPGLEESYEKVMRVAKSIKDAREKAHICGPEESFLCPRGEGGCFACRPFEAIIRGEATFVGVGEMRQDLYYLTDV